MAKEGAKVVIADPGFELDGTGGTTALADDVVTEIEASGGIAVAAYESVSSMNGGQAIIQKAVDCFGKLDIVVTCHGVLRDKMIFNMTEDEWDSVMEVHLKGTFTLVQPASMIFRKQRSGRIITFSSTSGLIGNSGQANYGAAKDAIAGLTRVVARDLGRYGVTANAISPGAQTRMTDSVPGKARQVKSKQQPVRDIPDRSIELRGHADDVAPFVTWLASDEAAKVNGRIFHVVGGLVSLLNEPESTKTIRKEGRWTIEELVSVFPSTIGLELFNPAPSPLKLSSDAT